jgi:hypothetical protein
MKSLLTQSQTQAPDYNLKRSKKEIKKLQAVIAQEKATSINAVRARVMRNAWTLYKTGKAQSFAAALRAAWGLSYESKTGVLKAWVKDDKNRIYCNGFAADCYWDINSNTVVGNFGFCYRERYRLLKDSLEEITTSIMLAIGKLPQIKIYTNS